MNGTCAFNMAELPTEDLCMRPADWHVRLSNDFFVSACDLHFGRALRPQLIVVDNEAWQQTEAEAVDFHQFRGVCGQEDTWWIEEQCGCLSLESALLLGYVEYAD
jgi:hypothetical protein